LCKTAAGQLACPKFHELAFGPGEKSRPLNKQAGLTSRVSELRLTELGEFLWLLSSLDG